MHNKFLTHFLSHSTALCRVFDRDGNGYITRDELQTAMEMIQESVTENQVTEMLALADLDKDGKINYEGKHENRCECLMNGLFFGMFVYAF